jgi:hypothetical protein
LRYPGAVRAWWRIALKIGKLADLVILDRDLRKVGATIAANNGATDDQLMAIFGWATKKQSGHYTRNADRKRFAGKAMHKLLRTESGRNCPTASGG